MKKGIKALLPMILILLVFISATSYNLISSISNYVTLVNYVGIVRGASQRLIKLETNGRPDDELLLYVDTIVQELQNGSGSYGLVRVDFAPYNDNLEELNRQWELVKLQIPDVRQGNGIETILDSSEKLFVIANDTVFSIESYSRQQATRLMVFIACNLLVCLTLFVIVVAYYVKQYVIMKRHTEALAEKAGRDELTGAYNSGKFLSLTQKVLDDNPRNFAIQYIDFENFKYVNDVFGYDYGDSILKRYTQLVTETLREGEFMARNVADRFLVFRYYTDREELLELQQQVDRHFLEEAELLPRKHSITIACGFCCLEDLIERLDAMAMVNRANYAQKTIKNHPTSHYAFYNESIREKMIMERRLQERMGEALKNREFIVYMQPKVCPADGMIKGAEALVRWQMPDGTILPPGQFVPVFEKNKVIGKLDQYVFEEVCCWISGRLAQGLPMVPISVNVSKVRFYTPDFVESYVGIKNRYHIPDRLLEIEFTETMAFENQNYMREIVKELHKNGFTCSLDDFGTGYSSLGVLKNMTIDVLKLDGSFFRESKDIERERKIISGVISMIRNLEIQVVAEGVELLDQVEFLQSIGCDLIQGYYYYRPMPTKEFEYLLGV